MDQTSVPALKKIRYPGFAILFVAWTLLGILAYGRYALEGGIRSGDLLLDLLESLSCYYPWLFLTPLVFRLEAKLPISRTRWWRNFAFLVLISFPASYLAYASTILLTHAVHYAFHKPPTSADAWWPMPDGEVAVEQALYWFTVVAACIIRNLLELREKERQAARLALEKLQLENSLRQAELENFRMRLNPHFLFNCLQNISVIAQQDPRTASTMLARLGDLLRTALQRNADAEITLANELTLTQAYVSIEKMRFGNRLSVLLDIAPETQLALIPSFLLQPLVENAIKHGLQSQNKMGVIWIRSACTFDRLLLTVSDNGAGIPARRAGADHLDKGIGLSSTCERLALMYPGQHTFAIQNLPEGGAEVQISLPLRLQEPGTEVARNEQPASADRR